MPETYYEKWEKLRKREAKLYAKAREAAYDARKWKAWERASKRLTEHENAHNTN